MPNKSALEDKVEISYVLGYCTNSNGYYNPVFSYVSLAGHRKQQPEYHPPRVKRRTLMGV